jgi:hypothetical protein
MSQRYRLLCSNTLDAEIRVTYAYWTRIPNYIHIHTIWTFNNAYQMLCLPSLNYLKPENQHFKSLTEQFEQTTTPTSLKWERIPTVVDVEKLKQWSICYALFPTYLDSSRWGYYRILEFNIARLHPKMEISLLNGIYIVPYPSLLLYTHDKLTRNAFLILTQEIKRDNIYKCMNLPPSGRQVTSPQRLVAHLDSTIRRLHSFFQYIASAKFGEAVSVLQPMRDLNLDSPWVSDLDPLLPSLHLILRITWHENPIPWQP